MKKKFRIGIIDFIPNFKKVEIGKYKDGTPTYLGDTVKYDDENYFIAYRYGDVLLKQVGMMAMIGMEGFKDGDFSQVEKTNIFGAGNDWLIIGFSDEIMYNRLKDIEGIELLDV